ncbi:MAG: 50S ribosomal protein L21 [Myxococcota bacterium]
MYAIIESGGKQYRVAQGDVIEVDKLAAEIGDTITLDKVLLVHDSEVKVGTPLVNGATVTAKVLGHPRGDKVITFKYRPTRRYRRRVGFRHSHTQLEIAEIKA